MSWQIRAEGAGVVGQLIGDDVAPTSLNEGRGEVLVPAFVVTFHLKLLNCRLLGGWGLGG